MKHSLFLILFFSCLASFASAENNDHRFDDYRIVQRTYSVSPETSLEVTNMYGNVTFNSWDADSVKIYVKITAYSESSGDLREMLEDIHVEVQKSSNFIIVESDWSDDVGFLKKGVYDIQQGLGSNKRIEVDVEISLPAYVDLEVTNKFGDVFMGDHDGEVDIDLSHGDLRAHDLTKPGKIKVAYGKIDIQELGGGRLELSYCEDAAIEKVRELYLKTNSSEVEIEEADELRLDCRHDEIHVESARKILGTAFLTDIMVEDLEESIDMNTRMGEVRLRNVSSDLKLVKLGTNMTDVIVELDPFFMGSIRLDLDNVKNSSISVDDKEIIQDDQSEDDRVLVMNVAGDDTPIIDITSKGGYFRLTK
ncbi:MAG: hypothetical protein MK081_13225 [Flavobacteriales bacterium]|nr:hypothetical protein [Flavobacteriales bacterium]